ncbi:MAG: hypothetical protein IAI50_02110 [Candidatus Eremiobacteraeota bacterium]|nr:hypothetical protein [Candidatus Eremiobacteraeota bacterium]
MSLLTALVGYHAIVGDGASALLTARGAMAMVRRLGQPTTGARIVQHVAAVIAKSGDYERAARMLGYADAAYARVEYQRDSTEQQTFEMAMGQLRKVLTWEHIARLESEGRDLQDDEAIDEALEVKSRFDDATAGARRH